MYTVVLFKMDYRALVIIVQVIFQCLALPHCKDVVLEGSLCRRGNVTDFSKTPEPWPLIINPYVLISQIGKLDFDLQAITILIELELMWTDPLISAKNVQWKKISQSDYNDFWTPTIQFSNILKVEKMVIFGLGATFSYWLFTQKKRIYIYTKSSIDICLYDGFFVISV